MMSATHGSPRRMSGAFWWMPLTIWAKRGRTVISAAGLTDAYGSLLLAGKRERLLACGRQAAGVTGPVRYATGVGMAGSHVRSAG